MATRFYLPASAASTPISPSVSSGWEVTAGNFARAMTSTNKIGDAMTTVSFADANDTNQDICFRQWISQPLTAGQTITGSQAFKGQCRVKERATNCNVSLVFTMRVIAADGTTVQKVVMGGSRLSTEASATSLLNRQYNGTTAATNYTTVAGDRICIEAGMAGDPGTGSDHDSDMSFGDSAASDLPEDTSTGTALNPWLELTDTLTFESSVSGTCDMNIINNLSLEATLNVIANSENIINFNKNDTSILNTIGNLPISFIYNFLNDARLILAPNMNNPLRRVILPAILFNRKRRIFHRKVTTGNIYTGNLDSNIIFNLSSNAICNLLGRTDYSVTINNELIPNLLINVNNDFTNIYNLGFNANLSTTGFSDLSSTSNLDSFGQLRLVGDTTWSNIYNLLDIGNINVIGNNVLNIILNQILDGQIRINSNFNLSNEYNLNNLGNIFTQGLYDNQIVFNQDLVGKLILSGNLSFENIYNFIQNANIFNAGNLLLTVDFIKNINGILKIQPNINYTNEFNSDEIGRLNLVGNQILTLLNNLDLSSRMNLTGNLGKNIIFDLFAQYLSGQQHLGESLFDINFILQTLSQLKISAVQDLLITLNTSQNPYLILNNNIVWDNIYNQTSSANLKIVSNQNNDIKCNIDNNANLNNIGNLSLVNVFNSDNNGQLTLLGLQQLIIPFNLLSDPKLSIGSLINFENLYNIATFANLITKGNIGNDIIFDMISAYLSTTPKFGESLFTIDMVLQSLSKLILSTNIDYNIVININNNPKLNIGGITIFDNNFDLQNLCRLNLNNTLSLDSIFNNDNLSQLKTAGFAIFDNKYDLTSTSRLNLIGDNNLNILLNSAVNGQLLINSSIHQTIICNMILDSIKKLYSNISFETQYVIQCIINGVLSGNIVVQNGYVTGLNAGLHTIGNLDLNSIFNLFATAFEEPTLGEIIEFVLFLDRLRDMNLYLSNSEIISLFINRIDNTDLNMNNIVPVNLNINTIENIELGR